MGTIKEQLIKEELAKPFEIGKSIRVKGKYLKFNTIKEADSSKVTKPVIADKRPGRNEPCPCGSGKKFKNCHGKT